MELGGTASMRSSPADQRSSVGQRVILLVVVLLLSIPILVAAISRAASLRFAAGDQAIIEMYASDIPSSIPLLGSYSRLGFHHPGPLLHYLLAGPVHLFGAYGLTLTAAVLAIGSIAGLLVVMFRRGGQALFVLGVGLVIVLIRSMGLDVLSVWNPYVLILPFALCVALTWSVLCGDRMALPWLAVVGSFVAQAHLGLAPSVAFLVAVAALRVALDSLQRRRTAGESSNAAPGWGRAVLIACLAGAVLWIPPVIEQFLHHPGNISQILDSAGSGESHLGLSRALGVLGLLLGRVDPMRLNSTSDLRILEAVHDGSIWWMAVPLLALGVSVVLARRRRSVPQLTLSMLLIGLVGVAAISFATITGLPYLYLERWVVVIGAFVWLTLVWTVLSVWIPDLDRRVLISGEPSGRRRSSVILVCGGLLLLVVAVVPLDVTPGYTNDANSSTAISSIIDEARSSVDGCGLIVVEPASTPLELQISSGLVAQLRRDGFDAVVADAFSFAHGPQHSLRGRTPDCTLVVTETGPPIDGGFPPFGLRVTRP